MTEDADDPPAYRSDTTWRRLLDLSDDELRQYIADSEQKRADHSAAGRGEAGWWASKSVAAGEYELEERRIARERAANEAADPPLLRAAALRIVREPGPDAMAESWVRDERWGWVCLESTEGGPGGSLEELLTTIDDGDAIETAGPGCTTADVLAALPPPEEVVDGAWEFVVSIDSVDHGPFVGHGWLPVDAERPTIPAHRTLVEITFSEEGGFTSGMNTTLLGEIEPGLLVQYWDFDGMDRDLQIFACEPEDYAEKMRSMLVGNIDIEQLAIDRALAEGSGSWTGDELDPDDGSPTATIDVTYDETILPPSG